MRPGRIRAFDVKIALVPGQIVLAVARHLFRQFAVIILSEDQDYIFFSDDIDEVLTIAGYIHPYDQTNPEVEVPEVSARTMLEKLNLSQCPRSEEKLSEVQTAFVNYLFARMKGEIENIFY